MKVKMIGKKDMLKSIEKEGIHAYACAIYYHEHGNSSWSQFRDIGNALARIYADACNKSVDNIQTAWLYSMGTQKEAGNNGTQD